MKHPHKVEDSTIDSETTLEKVEETKEESTKENIETESIEESH